MTELDLDKMAKEEAISIIEESLDHGDGTLEQCVDWGLERADCAFPYYSDCHEVCRNCDTTLAEEFLNDCGIKGDGYDDYAFKLANIEYSERLRAFIYNYYEEVVEEREDD